MQRAVTLALLMATCLLVVKHSPAAGIEQTDASRSDANRSESVSLRAERLVQQLGSSSFVVRQKAARGLVSLGIEAEGVLEGALESRDRETRFRSTQILQMVRKQERQRELAAFASDRSGRRQLSLPGWKYFSDIVGTDRVSRELFVEMQKEEWQLLAALGSANEDDLNQVFGKRSNAIYQQDAVLRQPVSLGSIAAILLAAGDARVIPATRTAPMINRLCSYQAALKQLMIFNGDKKPQFESLMSYWLKRGGSGYYGVLLARKYGLSAGLVPAAEVIDGGQQPFYRQTGILAFAALGSRSDISQLEKLLEDETPCSTRSDPKNRKNVLYQSQVRDVALATIIHLSGQKPEDFGFVGLQRDSLTVFRTNTAGFSNDTQRKAALTKWNQFQASLNSTK
jgi:hypothetical protein